MAKQSKAAYGIAEDGVSLKLAILAREGTQISFQALEQIELERSLYQHLDEIKLESLKSPVEDINLDDFTPDTASSFKTQPYEDLFQTYSLNQGLLAINTFEEQIIKLPINTSELSQKQRIKLVKENIPRNDYVSGHWQSSVVTINDQSELWIYHGANKLFDILEEFSSANKLKYFYQLADANEIALANLFIQNQPAESSETCMLLYLGNEYRRALLFEGNKWTFSLPIHVSQHQSDIDIIYSKLSLAMDESHIADPGNMVICGDLSSEEALIYLRNQLPNTNVSFWNLPTIKSDADNKQVYNEVKVAKFILPIALAWKALNLDQVPIIKSNFLPSSVIEGQKVFKIAWHGYLILLLLFFSSLYLTKTLFEIQFNLEQGKYENKELYTDYTAKKSQAEKMMTMAQAIDIQTANIEVIKSLLTGKNAWSEILSRLNNSVQNHPSSWITNLRKSTTGFQITGITTNRPNVVVFSNLFPNGSITKVFNRKIHSFTVWEFEINYSYPDVNWLEMIEADAQQLRKYQETKADKSNNENKQDGVAPTTSKNTKENKDGEIMQIADISKQSTSSKNNTVKISKASIDIPIPPRNLLANSEDPDVSLYNDFIVAYNQGQKWLTRDLGLKFINNFPQSPLNSYVRWYLSYRSWQNKEYDKPVTWLAPVLAKSNEVKPYALILLGCTYQNSGDTKRAEEIWENTLLEYPQHQVAKTARKLLNGK